MVIRLFVDPRVSLILLRKYPLDVGEQLAAISQPALVLTGDGDAVVPPTDSERLANALPNADYTVLANCGHVPQEECPRQFTDAVGTWLEQFDP